MPDAPARRWISPQECGELYGWHYKTVLALCRARRIPFARLPSLRGGHGQVRVDRLGLEQMLEAGLVMPAAASPLDRRRAR